jgi:transcriptional regulator with XRE-family HTH domain
MKLDQLGTRLRYERLARHWSQATLAKEAGVLRARISDLERGERARPSADTLLKLAKALGVSAEWLAGED